MSRRLRIGLTGGIASGKSAVARRLQEFGVPVIDADESARLVVAPGQAGLSEVIQHFGPQVLNDDGELDRRALRSVIFASPEARRELERILHPLIRDDMECRAAAAVGSYVVMAIPLLVEGGKSPQLDRILVVDVPEAVQLARLVSRDGGTLEQARAIIAAQASRKARLDSADDIIVNSGSLSDLHLAVDVLHRRYMEMTTGMAPKTP